MKIFDKVVVFCLGFNYSPHVDGIFYFRWIGECLGLTKMTCPHFGTWSDLR